MDVKVISMDEVILLDWSGKIWRGVGEGAPTPTPTATPSPTPNPYDVNNDGVVDILDIMLVAGNWQQ